MCVCGWFRFAYIGAVVIIKTFFVLHVCSQDVVCTKSQRWQYVCTDKARREIRGVLMLSVVTIVTSQLVALYNIETSNDNTTAGSSLTNTKQ